MAARALLLLVLGVFASASQARAATVDIVFTRSAPGSDTWFVDVNSLLGPSSVGGFGVLVSDSLGGFTPAISIPPIGCVCLPEPSPVPGFHQFDFAIDGTLPGGLLIGFSGRIGSYRGRHAREPYLRLLDSGRARARSDWARAARARASHFAE